MNRIMHCASVHSGLHIARSRDTLKVDPLTREIRNLVRIMSQKTYSRDGQLKAAALAAYSTYTDVAKDIKKAARSCRDIAIAVRERSSRLAASGYKSFLGPITPGQPHRNRHQASLNAEEML